MNNENLLDVRPSPIAGMWYPGTESHLRAELASYFAAYPPQDLAEADVEDDGLIALVVPHAGYRYSGATAAAAFQALRGKNYQKVIIVSPSHRAYTNPLITSGHDVYETPLGLVPVDHQSLNRLSILLQEDKLSLKTVRFDQEHALEIELPFLQYTLKDDFQILPVMMLDQREKTARALAEALFALIQGFEPSEKVLLLASTDLSHFHHQRVASELDGVFIKALQSGDARQLYLASESGKTEACGLGPTATILELSKMLGANTVIITDYRDSSYASGDKSSVVGYVSAIIRREDYENV
jgi:AmmeMemoRadiSam system protein B